MKEALANVLYSAKSCKLIVWHVRLQIDNNPKKAAKLSQDKEIQLTGESPDLDRTQHAFHLLKAKLKAERSTNKLQLKVADLAEHIKTGSTEQIQ